MMGLHRYFGLRPRADLWTNWPQWEDEHRFRTPNAGFISSWSSPDEFDGRVPLHKPRRLIDCYGRLLSGRQTRAVLEIGYLHGGMALFLAEMMPEAKIVAVDLSPPPPLVERVIVQTNLGDRLFFRGGIPQQDKDRLRGVLDAEFGTELPLDLITDDASHLYQESKASFEACFGYLRPGGLYIVEDWGWAHWNAPIWQAEENQFSGTTPVTSLLFELIMVQASRPEIIARVEILDGALAVITRGPGLPHRADLDIDAVYLTAGRKFVGFA